MTGPQLKINGEWIAIPEDFSLSLEQSNPLFNDQGTFSFPFEVPLEPNRHVFKNLADPFGHIDLSAVNGLDAELWFGGIMLYKGKTETEQEVEIADSVPITFVSGNSDFKSRIDGMNARDVPLDREIKLGYVVEKAEGKVSSTRKPVVQLPPFMMMNFTEYNVADPYPLKPYCNVRVSTQGVNSEGDEDGYQILPAKRPFSGVCFYVMYLFDCLFKYLGISFDKSGISDIEDINRLAFFTTKCKIEYKGDLREIPLSEIKKDDFVGNDFTVISKKNKFGRSEDEWYLTTTQFKYYARDVFATNENYPDVSIEEIISDLKTAFGIRLILDSESNSIRAVLLKDVFMDTDVVEHSTTIISAKLSLYKPKSIRITYGKEGDDNFDYNEYTDVKLFDGYGNILSEGIIRSDKVCKIDKKTGNAYRVKVNKDTGLGETLFEVGGFNDYVVGTIEGDNEEKLSIKFTPAISNDVAGGGATGRRYNNRTGINNESNVESSDGIQRVQEFAVFANVKLTVGEVYEKKDVYYEYLAKRGGVEKGIERGYDYIKGKCYELFDTETSDESPTQSYDAGYTLGIMRGPGSDAGLEFENNYDDEGNDSFSIVASGYAFSSDTCDNYGRFFDYNGTLPGGVKMPGTFSLKLVAGKPGFPIDSEYADRGLVSQFLSEYLYFLAHRKLVTLSVKMSISEIIHIDFLKRHRIGEFVGFINKVSYSLDGSGVNDVEIEMYIL